MSKQKYQTAKRNAYSWVQHADELYIAVRFLYWKGFYREFGLFGAHVMELYLKAYLIYKTGKYPRTHDLDKLYEKCIEYDKDDDFFKDETLKAHIVSPRTNIWATYYHVLRYPESWYDRPKYTSTAMVYGVGGTHQILDRIAQYVRKTIPRPKGAVDIIDEFIRGSDWWFHDAIQKRGDWLEIRRYFLHDNPCVPSPPPIDNQRTK